MGCFGHVLIRFRLRSGNIHPGDFNLVADVRLQVPKTKKKFRKQFSLKFKTCG